MLPGKISANRYFIVKRGGRFGKPGPSIAGAGADDGSPGVSVAGSHRVGQGRRERLR